MSTFKLPDLGEGLQEAEIVDWHVTPGDHVVTDQPLLSVETDKAVVEIPSPWSGTVRRLLVEAGAIAAVGAPLCEIETGESEDAGAIVGALSQAPPSAPSPAAPRPATPGKRVQAAPAVRKLAERLGVELAALAGSGPGGAITSADVEEAAQTVREGWEPLRSVRRAMARNMADAHSRVATATVSDEADVTGWGPPPHDVTIRLVQAIAAACRAEPSLNAWFDGERLERRLHAHVDLGIAVDAPGALFVPVLRDVGNRSADDLRAGLDRMRADIVKRTIPRAELSDPTLTLSNFGTMGGKQAALIVVPPQVAIIGAGRSYSAVRMVDGAPAERLLLPLSLSFDHRAATGGEAARFLQAVIAGLERGG